MDADRFDAFTRSYSAASSRRRLALFFIGLALGAPLALRHLAMGGAKRKRRRHKHKYKPNCGAGNRFCGGRCIGEGGCCTDNECRPHGECASCQEGEVSR